MCGILVISGNQWLGHFANALRSMASRGPDDEGMWQSDKITMGHRRLAVIDIKGGHQPMVDPDKRYCIVYNGELYNYRELRTRLKQAGRQFHTDSDTEVLLYAFIEWGWPDLLDQLDGIFAFAVWDNLSRQLFAARDRFGIKPLFYSEHHGFIAASTLQPFFQLPEFPLHLDYQALREYLASQYIPAPMTIAQEVRALPPASWLCWRYDRRELTTGRYWQIPHATDQPINLQQLIEATDHALQQSVKMQMVADVPLGAFLSGGIDSSLMVHYMAGAETDRVKTFNVRFDFNKEYDESRYARAVADQYGCEHHELDARQIDSNTLQNAINDLDQPFADPAYLPLRELAALTRRYVTVAIAGDGGDELFGGYDRFLKNEQHFPDNALMRLLRNAMTSGILPAKLTSKLLRADQKLLWDRVKFGPFPRSRKDLEAILQPEAMTLCHPEATMESWLSLTRQFGPAMDSDALMRADLWSYLSENCLLKTDRGSMAHSLELRVPMLGNPVVDLVLPQPASVKLAGGLKTVLNRLAKQYLPKDVWNRPKHGFSVPLNQYFRNQWHDRCTHWINRCDQIAPFFNAAAIKQMWRQSLRNNNDQRAMYTIIILLGWLEKYKIEL